MTETIFVAEADKGYKLDHIEGTDGVTKTPEDISENRSIYVARTRSMFGVVLCPSEYEPRTEHLARWDLGDDVELEMQNDDISTSEIYGGMKNRGTYRDSSIVSIIRLSDDNPRDDVTQDQVGDLVADLEDIEPYTDTVGTAELRHARAIRDNWEYLSDQAKYGFLSWVSMVRN